MATRDQIVKEARQYLGTPFKHQGRIKGVGCDCAGIIVNIAKMLGIDFWEYSGYGRTPDGKSLENCISQLLQIDPADLKPGDVMLFKIRRMPQHLAIATDGGMIHSFYRRSDGGRVVEHNLDDRWKKRIVKCFRFPGVTD
jgi:NlpC/P60 family putative phage cell wall peptidase